MANLRTWQTWEPYIEDEGRTGASRVSYEQRSVKPGAERVTFLPYVAEVSRSASPPRTAPPDILRGPYERPRPSLQLQKDVTGQSNPYATPTITGSRPAGSSTVPTREQPPLRAQPDILRGSYLSPTEEAAERSRRIRREASGSGIGNAPEGSAIVQIPLASVLGQGLINTAQGRPFFPPREDERERKQRPFLPGVGLEGIGASGYKLLTSPDTTLGSDGNAPPSGAFASFMQTTRRRQGLATGTDEKAQSLRQQAAEQPVKPVIGGGIANVPGLIMGAWKGFRAAQPENAAGQAVAQAGAAASNTFDALFTLPQKFFATSPINPVTIEPGNTDTGDSFSRQYDPERDVTYVGGNTPARLYGNLYDGLVTSFGEAVKQHGLWEVITNGDIQREMYNLASERMNQGILESKRTDVEVAALSPEQQWEQLGAQVRETSGDYPEIRTVIAQRDAAVAAGYAQADFYRRIAQQSTNPQERANASYSAAMAAADAKQLENAYVADLLESNMSVTDIAAELGEGIAFDWTMVADVLTTPAKIADDIAEAAARFAKTPEQIVTELDEAARQSDEILAVLYPDMPPVTAATPQAPLAAKLVPSTPGPAKKVDIRKMPGRPASEAKSAQIWGRTREGLAQGNKASAYNVIIAATQFGGQPITVADARKIITTLIDDPAQLVKGIPVTEFTSPSIKQFASPDGMVYWPAGLGEVAKDQLVFLKNAREDILSSPFLLADDMTPLARGSFASQVSEIVYDSSRRLYGVATVPQDAPMTTWAVTTKPVKDNPNVATLQYKDRTGQLIGSSQPLPYEEARALAPKYQKALRKNEHNVAVNTLSIPMKIQKQIMTDFGLILSPAFIVKNASNGVAVGFTDNLLSFDSISGIDEAMRRFGIDNLRISEGRAGGIQSGFEGARATGSGGNRYRNFMNWAAQKGAFGRGEVPIGNKQALPVGEQNFYTRIWYTAFDRFWQQEWPKTVRKAFTEPLRAAGLPQEMVDTLTARFTSMGLTGDKAAVAKQMRADINAQSITPALKQIMQNQFIVDKMPWKLRIAMDKALDSFDGDMTRINGIVAEWRRQLGDNIALAGTGSPGTHAQTQLDLAQDAASMVDEGIKNGISAGLSPQEAKAAAMQEAQTYTDAFKTVKSFLDDVRSTQPSNAAATISINTWMDLYEARWELRAFRNESYNEVFVRNAPGVTEAESSANWAWKRAQDAEAIQRYHDKVKKLVDDARLALSRSDLPDAATVKARWQNMYQEYAALGEMDFAVRDLEASRAGEETYQRIIIASQGYIDEAYLTLFDAVARNPTPEVFDVMIAANNRADALLSSAESLRIKALARPKAEKTSEAWDAYYAFRNKLFRDATDGAANEFKAAYEVITGQAPPPSSVPLPEILPDTPPAAVNPWEMTKGEFEQAIKHGKMYEATGQPDPLKIGTGQTAISGGRSNRYPEIDIAASYVAVGARPNDLVSSSEPGVFKTLETWDRDALDSGWELYIHHAIKEGETIPPNVMAEYNALRQRMSSGSTAPIAPPRPLPDEAMMLAESRRKMGVPENMLDVPPEGVRVGDTVYIRQQNGKVKEYRVTKLLKGKFEYAASPSQVVRVPNSRALGIAPRPETPNVGFQLPHEEPGYTPPAPRVSTPAVTDIAPAPAPGRGSPPVSIPAGRPDIQELGRAFNAQTDKKNTTHLLNSLNAHAQEIGLLKRPSRITDLGQLSPEEVQKATAYYQARAAQAAPVAPVEAAVDVTQAAPEVPPEVVGPESVGVWSPGGRPQLSEVRPDLMASHTIAFDDIQDIQKVDKQGNVVTTGTTKVTRENVSVDIIEDTSEYTRVRFREDVGSYSAGAEETFYKSDNDWILKPIDEARRMKDINAPRLFNDATLYSFPANLFAGGEKAARKLAAVWRRNMHLATKHGGPGVEIAHAFMDEFGSIDSFQKQLNYALTQLAPVANVMTPQQKLAAIDALSNALRQWDNNLLAGQWFATKAGDFGMLNYADQRNFDTLLSMVMPYHFFWSRSAGNWLKRMATRPALMNAYWELQQELSNGARQNQVWNQGDPARVADMIPVFGRYFVGNPLNLFFPNNSYLANEFVDPDTANNEWERWWLRAKSTTPVGGTGYEAAMAEIFDYFYPRPEGAIPRLEEKLTIGNLGPFFKLGSYGYQALTGDIPPTFFSGNPYMHGIVGRYLAASPNITEEQYKWAMDYGLRDLQGYPPLPNQPAYAQQLWENAVQQAGADYFATKGLSTVTGVPWGVMAPGEREMIQAKNLRREMGANKGANPYGSNAAVKEFDRRTNEAGIRGASYGVLYQSPDEPMPSEFSPDRPGVQATRDQQDVELDAAEAKYRQATDDYYQAHMGEKTKDIDAGLDKMTEAYYAERDAIKAKYATTLREEPTYEGAYKNYNQQEVDTAAYESARYEASQAAGEYPTRPQDGAPQAEWDAYNAGGEQWRQTYETTLARMLTQPGVLSAQVNGRDVTAFTPQQATTKAQQIIAAHDAAGAPGVVKVKQRQAQDRETRAAQDAEAQRRFGEGILELKDEYSQLPEGSQARKEFLEANPILKKYWAYLEEIGVYEKKDGPVGKDGLTPEQRDAREAEAREKFGEGIFDTWDAFSALPEGSQARRDFRTAHPELDKFWDWWFPDDKTAGTGRGTGGGTPGVWAQLTPEQRTEAQTLFGENIDTLARQYGKLPKGSKARDAFRAAHPELLEYWDYLEKIGVYEASTGAAAFRSGPGYDSLGHRAYGGFAMGGGGGGGWGWGGGGGSWEQLPQAQYVNTDFQAWEAPRRTASRSGYDRRNTETWKLSDIPLKQLRTWR